MERTNLQSSTRCQSQSFNRFSFFQMKVTGVEFSTKYLRAWVDLLSKAPLIDKDRLERFCFYRHAQEIGPADGRYGLFFACW